MTITPHWEQRIYQQDEPLASDRQDASGFVFVSGFWFSGIQYCLCRFKKGFGNIYCSVCIFRINM